jgi:kynurenine formamidase
MTDRHTGHARPDMPRAQLDDDLSLLRAYIAEVSNWGRWGDDDELGTLNLVGPSEVLAATRLVSDGRVLSLSLPYGQRGPQQGGFRMNPLLVTTATGLDHLAGKQEQLPGNFGAARGFGYSDDILIMPNQAGTQWDALSHIFFEGKMWNGRSAAEVSSSGALHNGVENLCARIVTRGVLLDFPRMKDVSSLKPGYAITVTDLEAAIAFHGVSVLPGDTVIIRTGFMSERRDQWADYAGGPAPGLSLHVGPWLRERDIAAVASDTWGVEVRPNEIDFFQPLHILALVYMGMPFGEMFDLDALAEDCAVDGRYEFLFVASPLPIPGASGAPVSALAVK